MKLHKKIIWEMDFEERGNCIAQKIRIERRACKDGTGHIFQLVRLPGAIRAGDCNRDKRKYGGSAHRGAHVHRRRTAARGADGRSRQQRRRRRYRGDGARSDAHTSELQSLMRISYAVFCLTKTTIEHTS